MAIGPAIGPCCYEVGDEVLSEFADLGPEIADGRHLDLAAVAEALPAGPASSASSAAGSVRAATPACSSRTAARARDWPAGRDRLARWLSPSTTSRPRSFARTSHESAVNCPGATRVLCATKYVRCDDMPILAEAGIDLVGENRLQDLEEKQEREQRAFRVALHRRPAEPQSGEGCRAGHPDPLTRERIGAQPSRKRAGRGAGPGQHRRRGREGRHRSRASSPVSSIAARYPSRGLSTMPPAAENPESSRPHFAALAAFGRRARPRAALDGHQPGLAGGHRGRRDDHQARDNAVALSVRRTPARPANAQQSCAGIALWRAKPSSQWLFATHGIDRSSTSASPRIPSTPAITARTRSPSTRR